MERVAVTEVRAGGTAVKEHHPTALGLDLDAEGGEARLAAWGDVAQVPDEGGETLPASRHASAPSGSAGIVGVEVGTILLSGGVVDHLVGLGVVQREPDQSGELFGKLTERGCGVVSNPRRPVGAP